MTQLKEENSHLAQVRQELQQEAKELRSKLQEHVQVKYNLIGEF